MSKTSVLNWSLKCFNSRLFFYLYSLIKSKSNRMRKYLLLIVISIASTHLFSQEESGKSSFTLEIGMPPVLGNQSFKGVVKPIVYLSPFLQRKIKNEFSLGFGFHYTYWQINEFKVPVSEPVKGGIHNLGIYLKPSYEKYYSDLFGIDFGVKIGYSQTYFKTDFNDSLYGKAQKVEGLHISPTLGFLFKDEEGDAYRFTLGYHLQGFGYSPNRIGVSTFSGYDPNKFSNLLNYIVVGFGYTHYFKR